MNKLLFWLKMVGALVLLGFINPDEEEDQYRYQ